jgi:predicted transcriptional regulator of viral defense system
MERKLKPIPVERMLRGKGVRLFSPEEFRRLFGVTLRAAQEFIKDHNHDLFLKLRNGLYALRSDPPHELEIANRVYGPSYVSLEYALAYYRFIPETVYTVTSATTKITREFTVQGKSYEYSRIKRRAYAGYRLMKEDQAKILMAVPEKALVDYCYFIDLRLKSLNDRLRVTKVNAKEALGYARLFNRESLVKLVREIL